MSGDVEQSEASAGSATTGVAEAAKLQRDWGGTALPALRKAYWNCADGRIRLEGMNNASPPNNPSESSLTKTALNARERQEGAKSRKVAFAVLGAISVLACGFAAYSWYLWGVTARACMDTYILGESTSKLLSGEVGSWQETFSSLDISSFSALILALLFTRLAYVGCRNVWLWARREGPAFFDHAHHTVLFTEGFETLSIRLGLLGTLLSFLLAALTQMSQSPAQSIPVATPSFSQSAAIAAQAETEGATATKSDDSSTSQGNLAASDLSGQMFLLLCASLVSTFVGTGVAYVITPSLNWLNDRAVGRHQIAEEDASYVAEEFFRQIARTSERLAQFETTTAKVAEAAEKISGFETHINVFERQIMGFEASIAKASERIVDLVTGLQSAVQTFEKSNQNGAQLSSKLVHMKEQSDRLAVLLERLPDKLSNPLDSISRTSLRFKEAAQSGEMAFRELKSAAGSAHDSLQETSQRSKVTWKLLHEVRDSLAELSKSDRIQTDQVVQLTQAMEEVGASTHALVDGLHALTYQIHHHQSGDGDLVESHVASLSPDAAAKDGRRSTAKRRRSAPPALPQGSRSWWRRWF